MWSRTDSWKMARALGLVLICGLLAACGYNFAGDGQLALPKTVKTLAIVQLDNPTMDSDLNPYLRAAIRDEFTRRGVQWAPRESADGLVTIRVLQSRTSSWRDADDYTLTRRFLSLEVDIKSAADGSMVWSSGRLTNSDTYMYDASRTEEQIISDLVKDLGDRLTQAF